MLKLFVLAAALSTPLVSTASFAQESIVAGKLGKEVDAYLQNCQTFGFSGCVLLQKKGKVALSKGYGVADSVTGAPNTPDTLYDIASASKQVTAAAILLLEDRGELDTGDSIAEYLPDVPGEHEEVTLYHLLTHTGGFPRGGPSGNGEDRGAAMKNYLSAKRPRKAGVKHEYYNGGYAMLAAVVEGVTGEPYEDWVRANLFSKAGMESSDFTETNRVDSSRLARSHTTHRLTNDYIKGWGYKGMGGVLTSIHDLNQWCNALFDGELLSPASMKKLLTPFRQDAACGWFSLTTEKGNEVIQHGGTLPGFQSYIRYFPEHDVQILVLSNVEGWHWQVAWGVSGIVLGEDPKSPPPPRTVSLSKPKTKALCGVWRSEEDMIAIEPAGAGFRVSGLGSRVLPALSRAIPGRTRSQAPRSSQARPEELEQAKERAMAIVAELRDGRVDLLGENMLPHIPPTWPNVVLNRLWPEFVETWGEVQEQTCLGAFLDGTSGRIRVWIRLTTSKATRSVEVAFVDGKLNIFNLKAQDYPVETRIGTLKSGELVGFDHRKDPPVTVTLEGKGKSKRLVLKSRSGPELTFRPAD